MHPYIFFNFSNIYIKSNDIILIKPKKRGSKTTLIRKADKTKKNNNCNKRVSKK